MLKLKDVDRRPTYFYLHVQHAARRRKHLRRKVVRVICVTIALTVLFLLDTMILKKQATQKKSNWNWRSTGVERQGNQCSRRRQRS